MADIRQVALDWIREYLNGREKLHARDLAHAFKAGHEKALKIKEREHQDKLSEIREALNSNWYTEEDRKIVIKEILDKAIND